MNDKQTIAALVCDLGKFEADFSCEGCGAPLFDGDDFVSDPDGCHGCWAAMTDLPSKRERPCYAYRIGKCDANAIATEAGTAETENTGSVHEGAGLQGIAQPQSPNVSGLSHTGVDRG